MHQLLNLDMIVCACNITDLRTQITRLFGTVVEYSNPPVQAVQQGWTGNAWLACLCTSTWRNNTIPASSNMISLANHLTMAAQAMCSCVTTRRCYSHDRACQVVLSATKTAKYCRRVVQSYTISKLQQKLLLAFASTQALQIQGKRGASSIRAAAAVPA